MKRMWREQAVKNSTSYREANAIYGGLAGCGLSSSVYYAELRRLGLSNPVRCRNNRTEEPQEVTPILRTDSE